MFKVGSLCFILHWLGWTSKNPLTETAVTWDPFKQQAADPFFPLHP